MQKILVIFCFVLIACNNQANKELPNTNKYPAPIPALLKAVTQWPDSFALRYELVNAFDSLDFPLDAAASIDSILSFPGQEKNYDLWLQKAQLAERGEDTMQAIRAYNQAIRIYPNPDALLYLANILAEKRDSNALKVCNNIYREGADKRQLSFAVFIEGVYYARTLQHAKAIEKFDQSIQQNYQLTEAYLEKAFILYEAKKYPEAIAVLDKANTVRSTVADVWYWLGKCYEAMQIKEKAIEYYSKALALDAQLKEAKAAIERLK